jgi:hypothetical protein
VTSGTAGQLDKIGQFIVDLNQIIIGNELTKTDTNKQD